MLNEPFQRSGAVNRVVSGFGNIIAGGITEFEGDPALGQPTTQFLNLQQDNLLDFGFAQRLENNRIIDPVEKFRPEILAQGLLDLTLNLFRNRPVANPFDQILRSDIRGHDNDRILETDRPPFGISGTAVIKNLQQYIENIRMRFLDFVEQDHRIGLPAHRLGQLTAFFGRLRRAHRCQARRATG